MKTCEKEMLEMLEQSKVKGLHTKSGMTYALKHFSEVARVGIGVSRHKVQKVTKETTVLIHSWSTFHRYMGISKEFVSFCKSEGVNKLHKLTYDTVQRYLTNKIDKGRTVKTLKTNMAALSKFFVACNRQDLKSALEAHHYDIKKDASPSGKIVAFSSPGRVIQGLYRRSEASGVVGHLQYLTGARISDVRNIVVHENTITIVKSKGGKTRELDFSNRASQLVKVNQLKEKLGAIVQCQDWQAIRLQYYKDIKAVCSRLKEMYAVAHGFRANYSQALARRLENEGLPDDKIELVITREMGHNRRSMARHYLEA
jgi:integrase